MAIRKVIKKKLTPKGRRFAAASSRLYGAMASGTSKARYAAAAEQKGIDARLAEYDRRVNAARAELGYAPGEAVERAVSGTDGYSGSSYRVGRGIPRVQEGTGDLRKNSDAEARVRKLNRRADNFRGFAELEGELRTRFGRGKVAEFRKTRTRSKTEKALRIGGRVIKGGTMAALAAAVLAEINKKKD
jgi:hypothetical protein